MTVDIGMISGIILMLAFVVLLLKATVPKVPIPLDPQTLTIMAIATHIILSKITI
tara:strand:+ start:1937 stop:2101 length:165 start_codon:yes stop_codon:yes gene_type:complete